MQLSFKVSPSISPDQQKCSAHTANFCDSKYVLWSFNVTRKWLLSLWSISHRCSICRVGINQLCAWSNCFHCFHNFAPITNINPDQPFFVVDSESQTSSHVLNGPHDLQTCLLANAWDLIELHQRQADWMVSSLGIFLSMYCYFWNMSVPVVSFHISK